MNKTIAILNYSSRFNWLYTFRHTKHIHTQNDTVSLTIPGLFLDFSCPSCPKSLHPHVYTVPSSRTNTVCLNPQPTSWIFLFRKKLHLLGSRTTSSSMPPKPSCPKEAFPQHNMVPTLSMIHQLQHSKVFFQYHCWREKIKSVIKNTELQYLY